MNELSEDNTTTILLAVGGVAATGILIWYFWPKEKCIEGTTKCINDFIHVCQNGQWVNTGEPCEVPPVSAEIIDVGIVY